MPLPLSGVMLKAYQPAVTAPIIGTATGAYDAFVDYTRGRVRAAYAGQKAWQDPFAQVKVAAVELPLVLPPRDGAHLKNRFREALLGPEAHIQR